MDLDKILEITENNSKVALAASFKEQIGKRVVFKNTRFEVRHGTLSEAHDRVTNAQIYYAAHREMCAYSDAMTSEKIRGMLAQADLMEAEEELQNAKTGAQELRANAKILAAKQTLSNSMIAVIELERNLDEANKVRLELMEEVESKYPEGIEQAQAAECLQVLEYKLHQNMFGAGNVLIHAVVPKDEKAKAGFKLNVPQLQSWMIATNPKRAVDLIEEKK